MKHNHSTARATCWSLTINNPTERDDQDIELARQRGWLVSGQKEVGAEGTLHYQLAVKTPQVRFAAVKRQFPRAHIEVARNPSALLTYVHKRETRAGALPEKDERYPSLAEFWNMVYNRWSEFEKDCLDQDALWNQGQVRFYRQTDDDAFEANPMPWLDEAVRCLIRQGYVVEGIACNPSVRSAWKRYAREILERCFKIMLEHHGTSETDRQTDTAEIPVVDNINADESSPPQAAQGLLEGSGQAPPCQAGTEDQEGRDEDCEECDCSESGE